ncbi:ABC transporter permease [Actinophytocola xanthii]|uniref:ABC transporter permease n=1 Tax=Actinophytocola xanthii TaxID=1912961 RepID=A0A1Q8BZY1_9PSEU|nr:ABC transporter permease [Actinophytocola xanthii]OLF07671.1 ABC transporter permease [Actinophytocola xanthii]
MNTVIDTLVTGLPLAPAFLGVFLVLRIRADFDLTVEGSFALGGAVTAVALLAGLPGWPALAAGAMSGAVAGLRTALLNLVLRIPVLMAGLVMSMALFTVTLRVLGRPTVGLLGEETVFARVAAHPGRAADLGMSAVLLAVVAVVFAVFVAFLRTEIGLALRASGANARMVRSQGVNDSGLLVLSLMLANGLSALSGGLLAQVQGFADVTMSVGLFVAGAGAVLLGALLANPGGSQVVRMAVAVIVGCLLYRLILVCSLRLGLPAGDLRGVTALTFVLAISAQAHLAPALARYRLANRT